MQNYVQDGESLTLTAPRALLSGEGFLVGDVFAVASGAAGSGATVVGNRRGVFNLTTLSTDTATVGVKAYWDNTNFRITTTASTHKIVGVFAATKSSGPAVGTILLDGVIR
jgi:predicted RecA/RadA family phage recombinase